MKVEVQFTDECPNVAGIVAILEEVLAEHPEVTVTLVTVEPEDPVPDGFVGSPTVLIDGRNYFGGGPVDAAACALHPPTPDQVAALLRDLGATS